MSSCVERPPPIDRDVFTGTVQNRVWRLCTDYFFLFFCQIISINSLRISCSVFDHTYPFPLILPDLPSPPYPPNFLFSPLVSPLFKCTKSSSCWPMTSRCGGSRGVWSVYQKEIRSLKRTDPSPRSHQVPIVLQLVVGPRVHPLLHLSETACWNMCGSGVWGGVAPRPAQEKSNPLRWQKVLCLEKRFSPWRRELEHRSSRYINAFWLGS